MQETVDAAMSAISNVESFLAPSINVACSQEALVTVCVMPTKIHVYYTEVTSCLVHSVDSLVLVGRVSMQSRRHSNQTSRRVGS